METLILIGVVLLLSVVLLDCVVRLIIVWNMRKRKRAVKPLDVIELPNNAQHQVRETDGNNNNNNNVGEEDNNDNNTVDDEDLENQSRSTA
jgi:hypothetical protein